MPGVVFNVFLHFVQGVSDSIGVHQIFKGVSSGLVIVGLGLFYPHIHGVGYDVIERILHGDITLFLLARFDFCKNARHLCYNRCRWFGRHLYFFAFYRCLAWWTHRDCVRGTLSLEGGAC